MGKDSSEICKSEGRCRKDHYSRQFSSMSGERKRKNSSVGYGPQEMPPVVLTLIKNKRRRHHMICLIGQASAEEVS